MKKTTFKKQWTTAVASSIAGIACAFSAFAQCCQTFPTGNVLNSLITAYPNVLYLQSSPPYDGITTNPVATFAVLVGNNAPIPAGTYAAWCVDSTVILNAVQGYQTGSDYSKGTPYSGTLISSCDPNEFANPLIMPDLGGTPPVGPEVPASTWNQVNWILNNKNGLNFWDVQVAINDLVGGPPQDYGQYFKNNPLVVSNLLTSSAAAVAAGWTVPCGGTSAAIYYITSSADYPADPNQAPPYQMLVLEVPCCQVSFTKCPPDMTLGCNPDPSSIPDCQNPVNPANVAAVSCCGYPVTITCSESDSTAGCSTFRILVYTASDAYGNTATCMQTVAWTTDTTVPVITSTLTSSNLSCNPIWLPVATNVAALITATDDCTLQSTNISYQDTGTSCGMTRTFTITVSDACGNISQPLTITYTWTADTNAPVITSTFVNGNLGCNPSTLPVATNISALVTATDDCTLTKTNITCKDTGTSCGMTRTFTVTVSDECGNVSLPKTVFYTWTVDTNAPTITSSFTNGNLGCNPPALPTVASVAALVRASDNCTLQKTNISFQDTGTPCGMTRTFTVTVADACGNVSATQTVAYTWTADTTAPVITSTLTGGNLGCNPASLPSDASVKALVTATDNCSLVSTNVSHLDSTNGCLITRTFTITATDGCGNLSKTNTVAYTWTADTTAPTITCPPDITISNSNVVYCTFTPGDYGAGCNGTNASSILTNCFKRIYTNGFVQCGITNSSGYCLKFTTCTNVQKFVPCIGTPGCLKANYSNPTTCEAGNFAGQVLCLKLNVDLGDCKSVSGFSAGCGDLVLNDPTCPLHGQSVRQILGLCHTALGGGNISSWGCSISNLTVICSNLNQAFEYCTPSPWCHGHLVPPAITNVSPSVTGYATVVDKCTSTPTLTYTDSVTAGACSGNYVIARKWVAVDGCGNSNYCTQNIYVGNSQASACGAVFLDCDGNGFLTPGIDSGISNVVVTLKNAANVAIATNTTDSQGGYCFYNLTPGTYTVSINTPSGCSQTAGTHTNHWLNWSGQQCWQENDGYQHCKGGDGVDRWTANDGCQHWKNSYNQDCWTDKYGSSHTQNCTYVSCDVPKGNSETFTLTACQNLSCVNFAYQGTVPKVVVCVTGPSTGICGQTGTYYCGVTNTGTTCFFSCQLTACGKSFTCPTLAPGQGCSIPVSYQFQWWDCGTFTCQAATSCTYPKGNSPCTAQAGCNTWVHW